MKGVLVGRRAAEHEGDYGGDPVRPKNWVTTTPSHMQTDEDRAPSTGSPSRRGTRCRSRRPRRWSPPRERRKYHLRSCHPSGSPSGNHRCPCHRRRPPRWQHRRPSESRRVPARSTPSSSSSSCLTCRRGSPRPWLEHEGGLDKWLVVQESKASTILYLWCHSYSPSRSTIAMAFSQELEIRSSGSRANGCVKGGSGSCR